MIVGKKIKEARTALKISQKVLAESLGIDPSQFSKIESGKIMPTLLQMIDIGKKLNKPIDWFIDNYADIEIRQVSYDQNFKEQYEQAKLNIELLQKIESLKDQIKVLENNVGKYQNKSYTKEQSYNVVAESKSELRKKKG